MKAITRFNQFINESARLAKLGLIGLNDNQQKFLDECTDGVWKFDPTTGLVNIEGDFIGASERLVGFKGIRFGRVSGDFYCSRNSLKSLEGAPQQVGGSFGCSYNRLTSLKGAPKEVGGEFHCDYNRLKNLLGAPEQVGGSFSCSYNQLKSLKGAPQQANGDFWCDHNQLTSLKGAPKVVGDDFYCHFNMFTNLKGAPEQVGGSFWCGYTQLTSLLGAPQHVGGDFNCASTPDLQSLEGLPKLTKVVVPNHLVKRLAAMRAEAKKLKYRENEILK